MLVLVWVSCLHCDGTVFSAGFVKGNDIVLERVGGSFASLLTLIGLSTIPFKKFVTGESVFIAVYDEASGVDEWGEDRLCC